MKRDYALWGLEWGRWSRVLESNQVSAAYRAAALPLSYLGMVWVARFERATTRFQGGDSGLTELHPDGRGRLLTGCRTFGARAHRRFRRPRGRLCRQDAQLLQLLRAGGEHQVRIHASVNGRQPEYLDPAVLVDDHDNAIRDERPEVLGDVAQ